MGKSNTHVCMSLCVRIGIACVLSFTTRGINHWCVLFFLSILHFVLKSLPFSLFPFVFSPRRSASSLAFVPLSAPLWISFRVFGAAPALSLQCYHKPMVREPKQNYLSVPYTSLVSNAVPVEPKCGGQKSGLDRYLLTNFSHFFLHIAATRPVVEGCPKKVYVSTGGG